MNQGIEDIEYSNIDLNDINKKHGRNRKAI
jgi:hypothetical protein